MNSLLPTTQVQSIYFDLARLALTNVLNAATERGNLAHISNKSTRKRNPFMSGFSTHNNLTFTYLQTASLGLTTNQIWCFVPARGL